MSGCKKWVIPKRAVTLLTALLLLLSCLPVTARAAEAAAETGKQILDPGTLTLDSFMQDMQAGSFILHPKKDVGSKIEAKELKFPDNTVGTARINFGGKATTKYCSVEFSVNAAASVKVWWVCGGDKREMTVLDGSGSPVDTTAEGSTKDTAYVSTLKIPAAGTYFLGSNDSNNYIFRVEVEEEQAQTAKTYVLDVEKDFAPTAQIDKTAADSGETAGTEDYFTLLWTDGCNVSKSSKTWEDKYTSGWRINFQGKADKAKNSISFTTNAEATVTVWWAAAAADRHMTILDSAGKAAVEADTRKTVKDDPYMSTFTLKEAGTYYLGGDSGKNYIFKVEVVEGPAKPAERAPWAQVAAPSITSAVQTAGKAEIVVKVATLIGSDGADKVTVTMSLDGKEIESNSSLAKAETHEMTFTPDASGTYSFSVTATRNDEETPHTGDDVTVAFTLPLTKPYVKGTFNKGGGSVNVEWDAVKEATEYVVEAKQDKEVKATATAEADKFAATLTGLTVGETYDVTVTAKRGSDSAVSAAVSVTVSNEEEIPWYFAAFGSSTNTDDAQNGYEEKADGSVSVWSLDGKGKLNPKSTDGIAFYYTKLSTLYNFKLTAKVHVDNWTYSNGQDGFGLMVSDRVGAHGAGADFWNNSYMAVVTKVEYNWNTEEGKVTDANGTKYAMRLGIGSQEKINVTPENLGSADLAGKIFKSTMTPLETSAGQQQLDAGDYNIIGNYTKDPGYPAGVEPLLTDFVLSIERTPTGYFVSYTPEGAAEPVVVKYYDPDALSHLDPDNIYLGFFASRNAKITVSDIEFTSVLKSEDKRPVEERPITKVTPSYVIESATVANAAEYDMVYYGNADGALVVKDAKGTELYNDRVTAKTKVHIAVTLASGRNDFTVTMTPDADYKPDEYEVLADYKPVTFTHTVNFAVSARDIIYVAPGANGSGSKASPMDIYRAVQIAAPGQTIVLLGSTYHLTRTLTIERGINGTADAYITMMADPDAKTRPVLDFGGNCAGVVLAGDYWHLYGFDVTRSANGQKGIQVSGNHNVLERLLTYRNGNTGIQISRFKSSDATKAEWPADNLVLNCSSYLNADSGYEDADGFAAKLTVGDGNRFYGCIAAYNADDGWDLYAKAETGSIGAVTIENCVTFKNGWILDESGQEVNAGNGNGFKMGGESLPGGHTLINSVSFGNKAKGFDSNSCPDIKVRNSTAFNNESYNVAMYTNSASQTHFEAAGILSYKNNGNKAAENFKVAGDQKVDELKGESNYYYDGSKSVNSAGTQVDDTWFESVDMDAAIHGGIKRNEDGSIDMGGFLVLTDAAAKNAGAHMDDVTAAPEAPELPELPYEPGPTPSTPSTPTIPDNQYTVPDEDTTYTLPVEVEAGDGKELDITVQNGGEATVEVPVKDMGCGVVAVLVHEDGTEEVIRDCVLTENGIAFRVDGSATVKIEDRSIDFTDMPEAPWAREAAEYVSARGLINGTGENVFSPNVNTTRGMAATVLYRLVYEPEALGDGFIDVADGRYYTDAVAWAREKDIINGYEDGSFRPDNDITRQELAVILYRFARARGMDLTTTAALASYEDEDKISAYARDAMAWCVGNGIINGVGDDRLAPTATATRAQTAAMLMRLCQLSK